jgi:hypothetical protein
MGEGCGFGMSGAVWADRGLQKEIHVRTEAVMLFRAEGLLLQDAQLGVGRCEFKEEERGSHVGAEYITHIDAVQCFCLIIVQEGSNSHALYSAACDPTSPEFGTVPLVLRQKGGSQDGGE